MKPVHLPALLLVPLLLTVAPSVDAAPVKHARQAVEQPQTTSEQAQPEDKKSRLYMALLMALKNR